MNSKHHPHRLPDWSDIEVIAKELRNALDNLDDERNAEEPIPNIRIKIARAIATMRADKKVAQLVTTKWRNRPNYASRELIRDLIYFTEPPALEVC